MLSKWKKIGKESCAGSTVTIKVKCDGIQVRKGGHNVRSGYATFGKLKSQEAMKVIMKSDVWG